MTEVYGSRYENSLYFAGALSGINYDEGIVYGQYFPYVAHDFYGSTVYPETLDNISEVELNNHAPRDPAHLLQRAEANLIVRESTASFFFHPYLSMDYLEATVEGLQDMGYTFVPVTDLK